MTFTFSSLSCIKRSATSSTMDEEVVDNSWISELESALLIDDCDFGIVRNISKGRPLPADLRADVWQIALNVSEKGNQLGSFNGLFDLAEQAVIRKECKSTVDRLGNDSVEKLALVSDLEEIITFYSKSTKTSFRPDNGWTDLLQLLSVLKLPKPQLYNCFNALVNRYIPRECHTDGRPFHLFRLLLLYHDPELCSFLDTRRITPDLYALSWGLFSSICDIDVCLNMWDVYLQQADPFLVFFLGLVLLVNAKDQVEGMGIEDKDKIVETLKSTPAALEADDIEDFCSLAQYYASKTPQSFRRHYQSPLFGILKPKGNSDDVCSLPESQALCLPVSIEELLHANELGAGDGVRYFVVDCRPAEQYNAGHLPTAFHLDADLMLQNPAEFGTAIQALVATQKQALESGSSAAGEHLCFMGSGREEEDQYVHMVIANFLQKTTQYVSFARGGYAALHLALEDNLENGITDHNPRCCLSCTANPQNASASANQSESSAAFPMFRKENLLGRWSNFSSAVRSRAAETKEKLSSYIKNEFPPEERHLRASDKVEKGYKNMASVFSIGDDEDDEDDIEIVSLELWLNKPDVRYHFKCQQIRDTGELSSSHLLVTDKCLYVLRDQPRQKDMAMVVSRRLLKNIVKITSKKKYPELITFKFGTHEEEETIVTDTEKFIIEKAGDAVKVIKQQVVRLLDLEEQSHGSAASGQD